MTPQNKPETLKEVRPEGFENDNPQAQAGADLGTLQTQVEELYGLVGQLFKTHRHNGVQSPLITLNTDIIGTFETVSAAPTNIPTTIFDQIKIYTNGTTYRLYWYDTTNKAWHYATGT